MRSRIPVCVVLMAFPFLAEAIDTSVIVKSGGNLAGEIEKHTASSSKSAEAVSVFITQYGLTKDVSDKAHDLKRGSDVCQTMGQADALEKKRASVRLKLLKDQELFGSSNLNAYTPARVQAQRNKALKEYGTSDDGYRYGATVSDKYPGGDMDSSLLFGDKEGNPTYADGQTDAIDALIARKTQLAQPDSINMPSKEATAAGQLYRENERTYGAYSSTAQAAYLFIKNGHVASTKPSAVPVAPAQ